MSPLIANILDVSPWQRIKADIFPSKKESKNVKDKIDLHTNIIMDLAEICRNQEDKTVDGFVSSKSKPFKKVIVKGKNTRLWRVYFIGPRCSFVVFPLPYEHAVCVQKLLNGSDGMHYINDVYCNHEWIFELPEIVEEYNYIYNWTYSNTNYKGAYNATLTADSPTLYKINDLLVEV